MRGEAPPAEVFADTCVLLNFVQHEWEHDRSSVLIECDAVTVVVSHNVLEELQDVSQRRRDIYNDMLDFLTQTESAVEEYDASDRHVYLGDNDRRHILRLQGQLAQYDTRQEVLRRLRQYVRAAGRRVEFLESTLADNVVDPVPPMGLRFAIDRLIDHDADTKVVTDAAAWTANGGSGILVTIDGNDILEHEEEIVEILIDRQGEDWTIDILLPEDVLSKTTLQE
jgi:hypothetical protein